MRPLAAALLALAAGPASAADPAFDPADFAARAAAEAADVVETARLRQQVGRLGSPNYREREAAGKELAKAADKALPLMRQALRTLDDPEAARRLEVLVKKLQTERLVAPTRVTLTAEKVPVKDLFAALTRQTGYKLNPGALSSHEKVRLSVKWKDKPFWEAIDEVCAATGLTVSPDGDGDEVLVVQDGDSYNPHVWYAGPFRFVATNIGSNRNLQLAGLPRKAAPQRQPEYLNLNFQIQSEPKNPIVSFLPPVLTRAVDDTGASLLPATEEDQNRYYYSPYLYRGYNQYAGVTLSRAARDAALIKEVRGKVTVMLLADTRPEVVIEDVTKVKKKTKAVGRSTELEIESVDDANGGVTVSLTARPLNPNPEDYAWANSVFQRLELWDDAGVKWTANGVNNQNMAPSSVSLSLTFTPPAGNKTVGKPSRLQFVEWITHPREVEFVFKDIPLP